MTIQLCAFNFERQGIDSITECSEWYTTPAKAKKAARRILDKYCEVQAVWIRKINDGHMRTIVMMTREEPCTHPGAPIYQEAQ